MYNAITTKTGIAAVQQFRESFPIVANTDGTDGLTFANNDGAGFLGSTISIPERLSQYLTDLRLLRHIPIAYLVPDAALLPPESIRFFHVDTTWLDRVVDGVFSVANTGTVDAVYSSSFLRMAREAIDASLGIESNTRITGMLIRSELVRRWPKMQVRAYSTVVSGNVPSPPPESTVTVLRSEPISKDLYLALFAGAPLSIHLREPFVGVRFGVEEQPADKSWHVDKRKADGGNVPGFLVVKPRAGAGRTLDITDLANKIDAMLPGNRTPRMVALELEQRPFVQIFRNTVDEAAGSVPFFDLFLPNGSWIGPALRGGRTMNVSALAARVAQTRSASAKEKP